MLLGLSLFVSDLSFEFWMSCLGFSLAVGGTIFLTSLFSEGNVSAGLLATCSSSSLPVERHSVGLLLTCLSFSLPVEGHFS